MLSFLSLSFSLSLLHALSCVSSRLSPNIPRPPAPPQVKVCASALKTAFVSVRGSLSFALSLSPSHIVSSSGPTDRIKKNSIQSLPPLKLNSRHTQYTVINHQSIKSGKKTFIIMHSNSGATSCSSSSNPTPTSSSSGGVCKRHHHAKRMRIGYPSSPLTSSYHHENETPRLIESITGISKPRPRSSSASKSVMRRTGQRRLIDVNPTDHVLSQSQSQSQYTDVVTSPPRRRRKRCRDFSKDDKENHSDLSSHSCYNNICRNLFDEFDLIAKAEVGQQQHTDTKPLSISNTNMNNPLLPLRDALHQQQMEQFEMNWGYDPVQDCPAANTPWDWTTATTFSWELSFRRIHTTTIYNVDVSQLS